MARNQEKAQSMLSRFRAVQAAEAGHPIIKQQEKRRPAYPRDDMSLYDCDQYRLECVREISRKVSQIQNATLGEARIRELNEMINALLRQKAAWERRIKELGGPDYRAQSAAIEADGTEAPGTRGYKYFGAAKNLPGVRELLEREVVVVETTKKSKKELQVNVDADYYGYGDDEDGTLEQLEREAQKDAIAQALRDFSSTRKRPAEDAADAEVKRVVADNGEYTAHIPTPSARDIEQYLMDRKKRELLDKYVSDDLAKTVVQ